MKHRHHVIPRHMGGTDDPSNIVELSVAEHAEAHRLLFEQYGHKEDELAWKGLAGIIGKENIIRTAQSIGGTNRMSVDNPWRSSSTVFDVNSELQKKATIAANSEESLRKKKLTFIQNQHQKGMKNSQYGTCWVYHLEHGSKKISKEELDKFLKLGYTSGRKMKTA